MSKTLAQLRAEKTRKPTRAARVLRVCLDHDLVEQVQALREEKQDLLLAAAAARGEDESGRPRRLGERGDPRLDEIDRELEALLDRMRESEGKLTVRAGDGGAWQRWKDDHPPRKDNALDDDVAGGYCNALDLLDDLGTYVEAWNDEDLAADDWDGWLRARISAADLKDACRAVVGLHEVRVVLPNPSTVSPATPASETS